MLTHQEQKIANFKLKIRKVDGYWNYDKSEFSSPSPIFESDDEIEEVINKQYPLSEFVAESNFKSYDELKARLNTVLSGKQSAGRSIGETIDEDEEDYAPAYKSSAPKKMDTVPFSKEDDDEDAMSYFQKLANE